MMLPKVSFIVPAYNVEAYIGDCIKSIMTQDYANVECVCVDDGSKDGTWKILDSLSKEYPKLKVIHQANQGVSVARNTAMQNAAGEFLAFVDSDDFVKPDFLTAPMKKLAADGESDIWCGSLYPTDSVGAELPDEAYRFAVESLVTTSPIEDCRRKHNRFLLFCAGGKIIRTSVVKNNGIEFLPKVGNGEDSLFMAECMSLSRKMVVDGSCDSYMRRLRPGSQTGRHWADQIDNHVDILRAILAFGESKDVAAKIRPLAVQWALGRFSVMFHRGYKDLWMRKYIVALCRHPEFKTTILDTIIKFGGGKYALPARVMKVLPRWMLIEVLFVAVCLNNLVRK